MCGALQEEFGEVQVILDEAVKLIEESAQKGNAWGMFQIGSIYMDGTNGVDVDHEQGFSWLVRSAKTGCGFALHHLATYYLFNTGTGIIIIFVLQKIYMEFEKNGIKIQLFAIISQLQDIRQKSNVCEINPYPLL